MTCPLLFLSRVAALRSPLSHVLCPAPTATEIHIVDGWPPAYHDLCPYPFPSLGPGLDPSHGLVEAGRRADVCGMRNLVRLASYLIQAKEDACSYQ